MQLLGDVQEAYRLAGASVKRQLNQLIFPKLYVEDGMIFEAELGEIIRDVLTDVVGFTVRRTSVPTGAASREDSGVVELEGRRLYRRERIMTSTRALLAPAVSMRTPGSSNALMVELRGIEPLTYSMRTSRATNCATAPMPPSGTGKP